MASLQGVCYIVPSSFAYTILECLTRSDAAGRVVLQAGQNPKISGYVIMPVCFGRQSEAHASPTQHGNPDAGIGNDGSKLCSVRVSKVPISLNMAVGELWLIPPISSTQLFFIVTMVDGSTFRMTL